MLQCPLLFGQAHISENVHLLKRKFVTKNFYTAHHSETTETRNTRIDFVSFTLSHIFLEQEYSSSSTRFITHFPNANCAASALFSKHMQAAVQCK